MYFSLLWSNVVKNVDNYTQMHSLMYTVYIKQISHKNIYIVYISINLTPS